MRSALGLVVALAACFAAAGLGAAMTTPSIPTWYAGLNKPSWGPPNWVFGPVWTALYAMMAVAAWLVWKEAGFAGAKRPLGLFALQLALNVAWSGIFFGLHRPGWAFAEILALWVAIAGTIVAFRKRSPLASWLMAPYLAWVSFAAVLNAAIWRLNG